MTEDTPIQTLQGIGPIFRSKDVIKAGVSWRDLYELRDSKVILPLSRGIYQLKGAAGNDAIDFITACARAPKGMICLISALTHWDFSDEIPRTVNMAVPEGPHRPTMNHPPTDVNVFAADAFQIGLVELSESPGQSFRITDRERTIADAYRLRHQLGYDLAIGAIRRHSEKGGRPAKLL